MPASTKHKPASLATRQPSIAKFLSERLASPAQPAQASVAKFHPTKLVSPTQQLSRKNVLVAMKQPQSRVTCKLHTEHRLPLNKSVQFHVSTNCVLSNNLCALVTHLIETSIRFEETRLVDKEGLLPLRGCRPTSDQKHLKNYPRISLCDSETKYTARQKGGRSWMGTF